MNVNPDVQRTVFHVQGFPVIIKTYMYQRDDNTLARTLFFDAEGVQLPHRGYTWYFDELEHLLNENSGDEEEQNDAQRQELRETFQLIKNECNSWQRIEIAPGVTEIEAEAFQNCNEVEEVVFLENEYEQSELTHIWRSAFNGNRNLKNVKFPRGPRFEIHNLAFACTGLEALFIPRNCMRCWGAAFLGCYDLKIVHIDHLCNFGPSNFAISNTAIFHGCYELTSNKMK